LLCRKEIPVQGHHDRDKGAKTETCGHGSIERAPSLTVRFLGEILDRLFNRRSYHGRPTGFALCSRLRRRGGLHRREGGVA
jgi:hypothetical protein